MMYDNYDASEYFEVLNQIRETGQMNMFGAPQFLQETFGGFERRANAVIASFIGRLTPCIGQKRCDA